MKQFIALIVGIVVLCFVVVWLGVGFVFNSMNPEVWGFPGRLIFMWLLLMAVAGSVTGPAFHYKTIINYFEKGEKK